MMCETFWNWTADFCPSQLHRSSQDIVKDAKDAAHFTAHVAGMIHTRSAKAWAQQSASRSAEALDQAQNLGYLGVEWVVET